MVERESGTEEKDSFDPEELPEPCLSTLSDISTHMTKPGRLVFVEENNNDGWISTDTTIEVLD